MQKGADANAPEHHPIPLTNIPESICSNYTVYREYMSKVGERYSRKVSADDCTIQRPATNHGEKS